MAQFDISEIMATLPHRYPFLLVDRVVDTDLESHITGVKNLTINEPFFQGHFPGKPIMPGVLQVEAMAQVAGILINKRGKREGRIAYFTGIEKARFRRMVVPGDVLVMEVKFIKQRLNIIRVNGTATVNGDVVSEAEMTFSLERD